MCRFPTSGKLEQILLSTPGVTAVSPNERPNLFDPTAKMATVKRDPLNIFQPFENLPPGHENQLTRALLLVLRLSPIAHGAWLARVAAARWLIDLPEPEYVTQRREIKIEADPDEPVPLVSCS